MDHSFCSEFYTVAKAVEVVVDIGEEARRIRIEALESSTGGFSTKAYIEMDVVLSPVYQKTDGKQVKKAIWVDYELAWSDHDDADGAIDQALLWLSERVKRD
jgi:hypothetical protein